MEQQGLINASRDTIQTAIKNAIDDFLSFPRVRYCQAEKCRNNFRCKCLLNDVFINAKGECKYFEEKE